MFQIKEDVCPSIMARSQTTTGLVSTSSQTLTIRGASSSKKSSYKFNVSNVSYTSSAPFTGIASLFENSDISENMILSYDITGFSTNCLAIPVIVQQDFSTVPTAIVIGSNSYFCRVQDSNAILTGGVTGATALYTFSSSGKIIVSPKALSSTQRRYFGVGVLLRGVEGAQSLWCDVTINAGLFQEELSYFDPLKF